MADHTLQSTIEIAGSLSPSLQSAINAAVSRLEEMSKETLEAAGASAQLAAKISTQETVLKNLEQGYADYIVTGQEGTEEAEQLASTIQELSGELTENRGTLDAAEKAARALSEPVETETDPEERIRELTAENRRLRKRIKQMREAAATSKKVEFSKIIFCGVSIVTILITVFSCWIIYSTMDASALAYLIPAVFAEMASATGFYYTKAKAENKIKLMNANGVQPEADNFNDF